MAPAITYNPPHPNTPMPISLRVVTITELHALAQGDMPSPIAGALPPPFVAQRALQHLDMGKPLQWCSTFFIIRTADQMIVGGCGFRDAPVDGLVEIGYAIAPDCRQQGLASAAVQALAQLALNSGEVREVLAQIDIHNTPSLRLVQKLGFQYSGQITDDEDQQLAQWKMTKPSPHA